MFTVIRCPSLSLILSAAHVNHKAAAHMEIESPQRVHLV